MQDLSLSGWLGVRFSPCAGMASGSIWLGLGQERLSAETGRIASINLRAGATALDQESRYDGPVTVSCWSSAGRKVQIVRPADPDRLLTDPDVLAWNERDDYMPYWAYLWPGAFLLAEAVAREPWAEGTEALEIGCGLGLAGLVALAAGLRVRFSDYDEAPLRFVARSVTANGFALDRVSTLRLDWREPLSETFPVILGADVLYERRLVPLVVGVLRRMLSPDGFALVAGPYRVATEDLPSCLAGTGLQSSSLPMTATDLSGQPVHGTLHRIWKGGSGTP